MDDKEQFEIRLITEAEHHFNDLCFKIRALASTWLLATFGGIGFLSTNTLHIEVPLNGLITLLCIASAIGITVLWVIDLLIYQPFLNCWFQCRTKLGHESQMSRMVYECMSASQPHRRATNFIKIYYHVTVSAPILCAFFINLPRLMTNEKEGVLYGVIAGVLFVALNALIYFYSPGRNNGVASDK